MFFDVDECSSEVKKTEAVMEGERYLQPLEVITFFVENGGKATNFELVNQFKPLLAKTPIGQENHAFLKRDKPRSNFISIKFLLMIENYIKVYLEIIQMFL